MSFDDDMISHPDRKIARDSAMPYYHQLQEILRQEIEGGRWKPGGLLPSEAQMTARFGVSRSVIRKALDILEAGGHVYRVNGKGTVVAPPKFRYDAVVAAAHWGTGDDVPPVLSKVITLQRTSAGGHIGRLLRLSPRDDLYELAYVQSVENSVASFTHMFLRCDATPLLEEGPPALNEGGAATLVQLEERYGLRLSETHLSIEATRMSDAEAELLDTRPRSAAFLLTSIEFIGDGRPVAFSSSVVRSDHFRFSARVRQPKVLC